MTDSIITNNLADFALSDIENLRDLLAAYIEMDSEDRPGITSFYKNSNSGYVWLQNEDYECWMIHNDYLQQHLSSPYSGHEGFWDELVEQANFTDREAWVFEDLEWLLELNQWQAKQFPLDGEQFKSIKERV